MERSRGGMRRERTSFSLRGGAPIPHPVWPAGHAPAQPAEVPGLPAEEGQGQASRQTGK